MKKAMLLICDGFGMAAPGPGNAVELAEMHKFKNLMYNYPHTKLVASGEAVGLPKGEVGNTEVGHLNIGAGRTVFQYLPKIEMSIADGSFDIIQTLTGVVDHLQKTGGNFHIIGLVSNGSVHSSYTHLLALLRFAKNRGIANKTYIHAITDGRDAPPTGGLAKIQELEGAIKELGIAGIASVGGRYWGMDRDKRWERIEKAYNCITKGGSIEYSNAKECIEKNYASNTTDEFIEPTNILINGQKILIKDGDAVFFFNFRIDRPRELTRAFVCENEEQMGNPSKSFDPYSVKYTGTHLSQEQAIAQTFNRGQKLKDLYFCTMTEYEQDVPCHVAFPPVPVKVPIGRVISDVGLRQLRLAESEKERFVGFYLNGLKEMPFPLEERVVIPSPKVKTYDLKPEMSAPELTKYIVNKLSIQEYHFIAMNFANADMVGHTGNLAATIQALKTLDECIEKIASACLENDYALFITADHGNAEVKIDPVTGDPSTEHTGNPVPFLAIARPLFGKNVMLQPGALTDIARTILTYMELEVPGEMTGKNLLATVSYKQQV